MKKRKKLHFKLKTPAKLVLLLISVIVFYIAFFNNSFLSKIDFSKYNFLKPLQKVQEQEKRYNECIDKKFEEEFFDENTLNKKNEIVSYASKNGIRYSYEDLKNGYVIDVNENDPVYGASLIKLVSAIYLLDKDVDLSTKVRYDARFTAGSSDGMKNHKVGESLPLTTLLKYSISYSDNTAHLIILDYIGKSNLKEYAESLGATSIFRGTNDNYGNQTTHDTKIYLKKAYELINAKKDGALLKEYMYGTKKNSLTVQDVVKIAHKYGNFNEYYHDIGLNFDGNPYSISVLTTKGYEGGIKYINNLSRLTKEFNDLYYNNQKVYCENYSKTKD